MQRQTKWHRRKANANDRETCDKHRAVEKREGASEWRMKIERFSEEQAMTTPQQHLKSQ
jgi:hypothetical protein